MSETTSTDSFNPLSNFKKLALRQVLPADLDVIQVLVRNEKPFDPWDPDIYFQIFSRGEPWTIAYEQKEAFAQYLREFEANLPSNQPPIDWDMLENAEKCVGSETLVIWKRTFTHFDTAAREKMKIRLIDFLSDRFAFARKDQNVTPQEKRDEINRLVTALLASYDEPHRRYHSLAHIYYCLNELDTVPSDVLDRETIELAIWYHDIIYNPLSKTNEIESAERMQRELGLIQDGPAARMIYASADHAHARTSDLKVETFLDIDLSILGQSPEVYEAYAAKVRAEYSQVPAPLFYAGRKKFLKATLKLPIYRTTWFRDRYERQAVANIRRELETFPYQMIFWI